MDSLPFLSALTLIACSICSFILGNIIVLWRLWATRKTRSARIAAFPRCDVMVDSIAAPSEKRRQELLDGIFDRWDCPHTSKTGRSDSPAFDPLGTVPLEIAAIIAEHMDMGDIGRLQRVSKRWRQVLSSTAVQMSAVKATMGASVVTNAAAETLSRIIKMRHRAETMNPPIRARLRSASRRDDGTIVQNHYEELWYSGGRCTWIPQPHDTIIHVLHLWSGKHIELSTPGQDPLAEVRMSSTLIAAISELGTCHVWNLENLEYKSFRLPEPLWYLYWTIDMCLELFLVNGTKVVLSLKGIVLHYSFDTDTALITEVQGLILLVSLHATEDQFSVVSLKRSGIGGLEVDRNSTFTRNTHQLHTQKYCLNTGNKFTCSFSRYRQLPFFNAQIWHVNDTACVDAYQGQTSLILVEAKEGEEGGPWPYPDPFRPSSILSIDDRDQVAFHCSSYCISSIASLAGDLFYVNTDAGLFLCSQFLHRSWDPSNALLYELVRSPGKFNWGNLSIVEIFGDKDFVVRIDDMTARVGIWCFDERWQPSWFPVRTFKDIPKKERVTVSDEGHVECSASDGYDSELDYVYS